MITLSSLVQQFEVDLKIRHREKLQPEHLKALSAFKHCRTTLSPMMKVDCSACEHSAYIPHSCGHRNCPNCQHHEGQRWIERQCQKLVPAPYFMLTFTIAAQFRPLFFTHQRELYALFFQCVWNTLKTFSLNDDKLKGLPGIICVLHTHSRALNFHPHIHVVMPAGAIEKKQRLWRKKSGDYIFNHIALAQVFRAKMLEGIKSLGFYLPKKHPPKWNVDCQSVGQGDKALIYLGRYLYRGVIREKDILACKDGNVTFRYHKSKTDQYQTRILPGADFLWLVIQHILPKGFRRSRDYGFLHANSKSIIQVLQYLFKVNPQQWRSFVKPRPQMICKCCGALMKVVLTRLSPNVAIPAMAPQ